MPVDAQSGRCSRAPACHESLPPIAAKRPPEILVRQLRVGNGRSAAQRRAFRQAYIDLGIHPRDKERCHRGDVFKGPAARQAVLQAGNVRLHNGGVAQSGEDQRDVDVQPRGD